MKDILKHPFVLAALGFFVVFIGTILILIGGSETTHVTQFGSNKIIQETVDQVDEIISETPDEANPLEGIMTQKVYSLITSKGNTISINNFGERASISSPTILTGEVPSSWIFEGIFGVNLYSLEGELIKEWYGNADIFDDDGEIIQGPVPFRVLLKFDVPEGVYEGKIRFAADNPSGMVENEDVVEIMVVFE